MNIPDDELEHCLYHVLIPRLEHFLKLDPCPAIHLANDLTVDLVKDILTFRMAQAMWVILKEDTAGGPT